MPCDCSGFEVTKSCFGKTYTGYSTRDGGDSLPYNQMIKEGEQALCKAQQVIRDLLQHIRDHELRQNVLLIPSALHSRAQEELRLLGMHEQAEAARQAAERKVEKDRKDRRRQVLEEELSLIQTELRKLDD